MCDVLNVVLALLSWLHCDIFGQCSGKATDVNSILSSLQKQSSSQGLSLSVKSPG